MTQPQPPSEDLREQAREHVENLSAESAPSNRDPQGGGQGEPADNDRQQ